MMRKVALSAIFVVLILLLSNLTVINAKGQGREETFGKPGDEYAEDYLSDLEYNSTLYGKVAYMRKYKPSPYTSNFSEPRRLVMHRYEIKIVNISYRYKCTSEKDYFVPFKCKFLVIGKQWMPKQLKYAQENLGYEEPSLPVHQGNRIRKPVQYIHYWYTNLDEKTESVYELKGEGFKVRSRQEVEHTSLRVSIKRYGRWSLVMLVKPLEGDYWLPFNGVPIQVVKPKNGVRRSLPVVFPTALGLGFIATTISIRQRKNTLEKIKNLSNENNP